MKRHGVKRKREDIEFDISFLLPIVKGNPRFYHATIALANAYIRAGNLYSALFIYLWLVKEKPKDPIVHYNLACVYSLLNQTDKAIEMLKRAIKLGYRDAAHAAQDKDLDPIKSDPRFWLLMDSIQCF